MNFMKIAGRNIPFKKILILDLALILIILASVFFVPVPKPVKGLQVTDTDYHSVTLSWDQSKKAAGYNVYRSSDNGETYELAGTVTEPEFTDTHLTADKEYIYKVESYTGLKRDPLHRSPKKVQTVSATPVLRTPDIEIYAADENGNIKLEIEAVDGATSYEIYRDDVRISNQTELTFIDKAPDEDEKHNYAVRAQRRVDGVSYSEMSSPEKVSTTSPGELTAEIQDDMIFIDWDGADEYSTYKLYNGKELLTETSYSEFMMEEFEPDKKYELSLRGFGDKTRSPWEKMNFVIAEEELTNEEAIDAACEWGVKIAEDNSFTYGTGERAHRFGCYFCGNNLDIKGDGKVDGHSYEKTYCCNPFVHACFAHGAGDPVLLESCSQGKGIGMTESTYTRYGCFEDLGKPDFNSLQRGDILVANPDRGPSGSNHVTLYLGDGLMVHAARGGWDDDSILVSKVTDKKYKRRFDFVMRYTGNGKGTKYVIKETEE